VRRKVKHSTVSKSISRITKFGQQLLSFSANFQSKPVDKDSSSVEDEEEDGQNFPSDFDESQSVDPTLL
jgi:hypothetical protein